MQIKAKFMQQNHSLSFFAVLILPNNLKTHSSWQVRGSGSRFPSGPMESRFLMCQVCHNKSIQMNDWNRWTCDRQYSYETTVNICFLVESCILHAFWAKHYLSDICCKSITQWSTEMVQPCVPCCSLLTWAKPWSPAALSVSRPRRQGSTEVWYVLVLWLSPGQQLSLQYHCWQ